MDSNWFVVGFDKYRVDFLVLIWDICSKYIFDIVFMEKVRFLVGEVEIILLVIKSLYELG